MVGFPRFGDDHFFHSRGAPTDPLEEVLIFFISLGGPNNSEHSSNLALTKNEKVIFLAVTNTQKLHHNIFIIIIMVRVVGIIRNAD